MLDKNTQNNKCKTIVISEEMKYSKMEDLKFDEQFLAKVWAFAYQIVCCRTVYVFANSAQQRVVELPVSIIFVKYHQCPMWLNN